MLAALAAILAGDDGGASIAAALPAASRGGIKCTSFGECLDVLRTEPDIDYDGITGPVNFDDAGTARRRLRPVRVYGGEQVPAHRVDYRLNRSRSAFRRVSNDCVALHRCNTVVL